MIITYGLVYLTGHAQNLRYDVYFGTNPNPPLVSVNQPDTTYTPPTLDTLTLYFWRVVARDTFGAETSSPIWHFWTGDDPVPVELSSFTYRLHNNDLFLDWITETEIGNYGFEIQESLNNDDNYKPLDFIEGYGNSNVRHYYQYTKKLSTKGKYYYRLKQIDTDGSITYLSSLEINFNAKDDLFIYPNPFNSTFTYELSSENGYKLEIYSITGELVDVINSTRTGIIKERYELNAPSGVYLIRYNSITKKVLNIK